MTSKTWPILGKKWSKAPKMGQVWQVIAPKWKVISTCFQLLVITNIVKINISKIQINWATFMDARAKIVILEGPQKQNLGDFIE